MSTKHSHYYKDVRHLNEIDVYRVLSLFGVTDPCVQHAVKKLLCAGGRGAKDQERDLREAVDSINRALEMRLEDCYEGKLVPQAQFVTATLEVKVDPAARLLVDAVKVLRAVESDSTAKQALRIHARALLRRIENTDYSVTTEPMPDNPALTGKHVATYDSGAAASAQGVDLVTEELSKARARMPLFKDSAMVPEAREVDSYQHIASGIKGTQHGS